MLKKCISSFKNARTHLEIAQRISNFEVKVVGENRLLAKILVELQKSVSFVIDSFIYYEAFANKIRIPADKETRAKLFFDKVSKKYLSEKQSEGMKQILRLTKEHKKAHFEFVKKDKFVIFDEKGCKILTSPKLKELIAILNSVISNFPLKA